MTFTILSSTDLNTILRDLDTSDVTSLAKDLVHALVQYSCHDEQQYQPHRGVVTRPGGQVSLFMPATTNQSIGVKIVGILPSQDLATISPDATPKPALQSALTLCDAVGQAIGILNAAELTAFRTALGSMLLYKFRKTTEHIVVFGAGKQALWHIRLAVLLRGPDIRKITVINRSSRRTKELVDTLSGSGLPSHVSVEVYGAPENGGHPSLEDVVVSADIIFCTTPSTKPLFPAAYLTSEKARGKTRFISAIGSYRLDMAEIDPELLKMVTDPAGSFTQQVWHANIAVDSAEGCLKEAGELVTAGTSRAQMVEIGQIEHLRTSSNIPDGLKEWLESGFVIYKSVGMGVMDIAVGTKLLELARTKNIGTHLKSF